MNTDMRFTVRFVINLSFQLVRFISTFCHYNDETFTAENISNKFGKSQDYPW